MSNKVYRNGPDADAALVMSDEEARLQGAQDRFIKVNENGTTIYGPVSIVAGPESNKSGGIFAEMPNLVRLIPPTIVTPIPTDIPMPPIAFMTEMVEDISYFASLLVGLPPVG